MSLRRYQPWNTLNAMKSEQFHHDLSQFFNPAFNPGSTSGKNSLTSTNTASSDWIPAVDVKETENEFVLHADIPGVDPKDIDVHMEKGLLTMKGHREANKTDENEGYTRVERSYGAFMRRFTLPDRKSVV